MSKCKLLVELPSATVASLLAARLDGEIDIDDVIEQMAKRDQNRVRTSVLPSAKSKTRLKSLGRQGKYSFELLGECGSADTLGDLLVGALRSLAELDNRFLPKLAEKKARTRRLVARNPVDIYPNNKPLAHYSKIVCDGWWVGTNYSRQDVIRILSTACRVAGINWNEDLLVNF